MTSEELGQDLEHVEVLQKKFEEFQTDLAAHEERVNEVNQFAGKLIQVGNLSFIGVENLPWQVSYHSKHLSVTSPLSPLFWGRSLSFAPHGYLAIFSLKGHPLIHLFFC